MRLLFVSGPANTILGEEGAPRSILASTVSFNCLAPIEEVAEMNSSRLVAVERFVLS